MSASSVYALAIAFLVILIVVLLALILCYVSRWRSELSAKISDGEVHLIPHAIVHENHRALGHLENRLLELGKTHIEAARATVQSGNDTKEAIQQSDQNIRSDQRKTLDALQAVLSVTKSLREEVQILREEIQRQAQELERHRNGYDVDILCTSMIPIARMHRMLKAELSKDGLDNSLRNTLIPLEDEHFGVLETNGVRLVYPEVGARYRDQINVQHPPATRSARANEPVGSIVEVLHPAYQMERSARTVVLLNAEVVVSRQPEVDVTTSDNTDNAQAGIERNPAEELGE